MSGPDLRTFVLICTGCDDWTLDVPPRAVSDFGGQNPAAWAVGEAHAEHVQTCPGGTVGRVKVQGQWAERPLMTGGKPADGVMVSEPLPRWWVWR